MARWEVNRVRSVHGPHQVSRSLAFVLSLLKPRESLPHSLVYFYCILNPKPGVKDLESTVCFQGIQYFKEICC